MVVVFSKGNKGITDYSSISNNGIKLRYVVVTFQKD